MLSLIKQAFGLEDIDPDAILHEKMPVFAQWLDSMIKPKELTLEDLVKFLEED